MSDPQTKIAQFLQGTELFAYVPEANLAQVAKACTSQSFRTGATVFEQGAAVDSLYLVLRGSIELRRRDVLTGMDYLLAIYGEAKSFGEENVVADDTSPIYAVTTAETELLRVAKGQFRQLMQQFPQVGIAVSRILARRTHRFIQEKGIRFISLSKIQLDKQLVTELPKRMINELKVLPVARKGRTVTLAMVNPYDMHAYDEVQRALRDAYIEAVGVSESEFEKFVSRSVAPLMDGTLEAKADPNLLPRMPARTYNLRFLQEGNENISEDERKASVAGEQVVNLLNQLIGDALSLDASDIHIEPHETELSVRYRIDGRLLKRAEVLPMRFANAISSRLKALASMNITERRKPQDGRLGTAFNNREVSLRISTIPTRFGEKIVMRVLDKSQSLVSLDRIIGLQEVKELVRSLVFQPHGIVLITGPTGSGKTTTMYSAILERKEEGINIVTVEDPIEYTIPGITQVQYNDAVDLGYAEAIKAFLRQDTDIMLIGETRDARTASYAMQAALSGHLVVTSLHTNSALSTIYRLREMGIEPFLIGNALAGVIAQRLLRTICSDCREPHTYHPSLLSRIFEPGSEIPTLYHGPGCARCNRTGYRGRAAVFEVIRMSEDLRSGIAAGSPMKELRTLALDAGMVTFKDYCRKLLVRGLTTPSEIMRVLYSEDDNGPKKEAKACSSCGFSNALGNRYCEECGTQL
jgi:type IV pilus assembly protein PilB